MGFGLGWEGVAVGFLSVGGFGEFVWWGGAGGVEVVLLGVGLWGFGAKGLTG